MSVAGYPGPLSDEDFARIVNAGFGRVQGPTDFTITPGAGTREVSVSAGLYIGQGIRSSYAAPKVLTGGAVAAVGGQPADRWDCVVLRMHWEDGNDNSELYLAPGTADLAYPSGLQTLPIDVGDEYDVPLGLVRFRTGLTAVQQIVPTHPFGGGPALFLVDPLAPLPGWAGMGTKADRAGELWTRVPGATPWRCDRPARTSWTAVRDVTETGGAAGDIAFAAVNPPGSPPPGRYLVRGDGSVQGVGTGSEAIGGFVRLHKFTSGGVVTVLGVDKAVTLGRANFDIENVTLEREFVHTGGPLGLAFLVKADAVAPKVFAGSSITLEWAGPA
jgi:hypothetical protein